jgi:hypothetical protein
MRIKSTAKPKHTSSTTTRHAKEHHMSTPIVTPAPDSPPTTPTPPTTDDTLPGVVELYQRFLPMAQKLTTEQVRRMKLPVGLVLLNAARGTAALMERRAEVAAMPGISIDQIDALPEMGQALQYAVGRVERFMPITGEIRAMLATAGKRRADLLAKADVLVIDGIVPASTVAGIRKGRGPTDVAGDCIALAALYHEHAGALTGHVTVSAADIQAASDIGAKLLAALRPDTARRTPDKDLTAAFDVRDRLWTVFEQTWEQNIWRPGAWLYGRDVEQHVPPLGARMHRRPAKPAPVVGPVAPTVTPAAAPTAAPTVAVSVATPASGSTSAS